MPQFVMPSLGADMTEGTLLTWLVHPGDIVHPGDVIAEVDTTKAAIEVECFDDGVIGEILVPEGETVPVGTPLATIEPATAAAESTSTIEPRAEVAATSAPESRSAAEPSIVVPRAEMTTTSAPEPRSAVGPSISGPAGNGSAHEGRATPLVRRLAEEAGIDLRTVHGSGHAGRIVRADIDRAAARIRAVESSGPDTERRDALTAGANPEPTEPGAPPLSQGSATAAGRSRRDTSKSTRRGHAGPTPEGRDKFGRARESGFRAPAEPTTSAVLAEPLRRTNPDMSGPPVGIAESAAPREPAEPTEPGTAVQPAESATPAVSFTPSAVASPTKSTAPDGSRSSAKSGIRVSGYARRLARELGVDLRIVVGSGPAGAIRAMDIRAAQRSSAEAGQPGAPESAPAATRQATASVTREMTRSAQGAAPATGSEPGSARDRAAMRSLIAAAMTRSKRTVPHYYLSATIDMDAASRWLRAANRLAPVAERILAPALLLRATALAARKVPELNGFWIEDEFRPAAEVHLGFVVSLRGGGIIVPTIPRADTLGVPAMMTALRGVVSRSRDARLHAADTTPATLTITNLGELGVDSVYGVIAAPQVAIVGFGAISDRPCAVDGLLGVRPQLTVTLSADHRASDGAIGARFLHALSDLLQHPEDL